MSSSNTDPARKASNELPPCATPSVARVSIDSLPLRLKEKLAKELAANTVVLAPSSAANSRFAASTRKIRCLWAKGSSPSRFLPSGDLVLVLGEAISLQHRCEWLAAGAAAVYDLEQEGIESLARIIAAHSAGLDCPSSFPPPAALDLQGGAYLATAVEELPLGVYCTDGSIFTIWNNQMAQLFGKSADEVIGRSVEQLFSDPLYNVLFAADAQDQTKRRAIIPPPAGAAKTDAPFIADVFKTRLRHTDGSPLGLVGIIHDLTGRVQSENRLVQAFNELESSKEKLEQSNLEIRRGIEKAKKLAVAAQSSNRAKSFLLSNISHELRTPLTSIISLTHALLEGTFGKINAQQAENLEIVAESGRHLQSLITDVLDLSKIELGKMNLKFGAVQLRDLALSCIRMMEQQAKSKRIECLFECNTSLEYIEADSKRLRQILLNLLVNAVKFTSPRSTVTLAVEDTGDPDCARFRISDQGIGIRECDVAQIFAPFTQLDDSLSRQYEGTGLGLAIVSKFVELHGGGVSVRSRPENGASFIVSLPVKQLELAPTSVAGPTLGELAPNSRHRDRLLLIVDENERVAELHRAHAGRLSNLTPVAAMPNEIAAYQDQIAPTAVVVDLACLATYGSDWIQQAQQIESWEKTRWIATGSLGSTANQEFARRLSFHRFVPKPLTRQIFAEILR